MMKFTYIKGATPLSPDEIHNLIPKHLTKQHQLDEWEQYNIARAEMWFSNHKIKDILSIDFVKKLHRKMFCDTWAWAGKFRQRQTNIGVDSIYIQQELKILIDDVIFWQNNATFSVREVAVRLHHRSVFIHPFPNGNGRFSRLFADLYLLHNNELKFSWGSNNLIQDSSFRNQYLQALRLADSGDYTTLIAFADS
jgi:Fic-DOC domain mobile mystery protein B